MTDTTDNATPINSVEELLAHALVLENEASDRYEDMADNMESHNNPEVAAFFRQMAGYGRKHAAEVEELSKGRDIPHIAPWDLKWGSEDGASPEAPANEDVHYLMTPFHALSLAMSMEKNARDFYAGVVDKATNSETKKIASEFAEEESEHVALLEDWIKKYPEPEEGWDYDPDPPNAIE